MVSVMFQSRLLLSGHALTVYTPFFIRRLDIIYISIYHVLLRQKNPVCPARIGFIIPPYCQRLLSKGGLLPKCRRQTIEFTMSCCWLPITVNNLQATFWLLQA
jgi:hypothetical protein